MIIKTCQCSNLLLDFLFLSMALQLANPRSRQIREAVQQEEQRLRQSSPLVRRRRPKMLFFRSGRVCDANEYADETVRTDVDRKAWSLYL